MCSVIPIHHTRGPENPYLYMVRGGLRYIEDNTLQRPDALTHTHRVALMFCCLPAINGSGRDDDTANIYINGLFGWCTARDSPSGCRVAIVVRFRLLWLLLLGCPKQMTVSQLSDRGFFIVWLNGCTICVFGDAVQKPHRMNRRGDFLLLSRMSSSI